MMNSPISLHGATDMHRKSLFSMHVLPQEGATE